MVRVKICGITNYDDASFAQQCGADALGFVFSENSKRYINPDSAAEIINRLNPFILKVGVFVNDDIEEINQIAKLCKLDYIQLYGSINPVNLKKTSFKIIKAIHFNEEFHKNLKLWKGFPLLIDSGNKNNPGGTGKSLPWVELKQNIKEKKVILAGGLNPENVREAIKIVNPMAVDVSSGVEKEPGKKDQKKVQMFIENAKGIDEIF